MSTLTLSEAEAAKHAAWLEDRRKGITSSEVAILFGEGYSGTSPSLLYAQKKGLAPDMVKSEKVEWGLLLEDDIAEMYFRQTGIPVTLVDPYEVRRHKDQPRFMASLDGFDAEGCLIEIKNTELYIKDEGDLFMGWRIQAQWQMFVLGETRCKIVCCVRGCKLVIIEQTLDEEFIKRAEVKAADFLGRLDAGTPPPVTVPEDNDAMKYLYTATPEKAIVVEDLDVPEMLDERAALSDEIKKLTARKKLLEANVKAYVQDAEVAILPDGGKVTWKNDKSGRRQMRHYQPRS